MIPLCSGAKCSLAINPTKAITSVKHPVRLVSKAPSGPYVQIVMNTQEGGTLHDKRKLERG